MKSLGKLMWVICFVTAFGALHKGLEVFGFDIPARLMPTMPMVAKGLMLFIGFCGLISLLGMFVPGLGSCSECK